jgi:peptidoglycan/xylan/chitin deacetylase (PgdA/CDA1 family)
MAGLSTWRQRLARRFAAASPAEPCTGDRARGTTVTFYHDVEQDLDSSVDRGACRAAVDGFLDLEGRLGIRATYNVAGLLLQRDPDLRRRIERGGHEIAFHSHTHDPGWSPARYAEEVRACRAFDTTIKGYRSPRSQWDASTLDALWSNGFLWNAESDRAAEPYFVYEGLVRLPIGADDWSVFTGRSSLDQWVARFDQLAAERSYFGFGTHDFVVASSPDQRLAAYERVIAAAIARGARAITFGQAAEEFRGRA